MAAGPAAAAPNRASYVEKALTAVKNLGPAGREKLATDIYLASRTKCRADVGTPAPTCLVEVGKAACNGDKSCEAAADVITANILSVPDFIDDAKRMRIAQASTDYRAGLAAELRKRYATLAAEMVIAGADGNVAAAIERTCRERDREIHACAPGDAACVPSISWSRCVAAIVWFVGGSP